MKSIVICLVFTALCTAITPVATAQVAPVCREVAADADGDGFGWQDSASCIVTQESEPAPVFTNLETGGYVSLIRAYWNAPADLYNKTITCIASRYSRDTGTYVADNDPARETHYSFHYTHLPLITSAPYTGTVKSEHIVTAGPRSDFYREETFVSWSMDNGIYTGGAPFTESPYVEIVSISSTGEKAIRTWRGNSEYVQCTVSPTGVPPGSGNQSATELADDEPAETIEPESGVTERTTDTDDEYTNTDNGINAEGGGSGSATVTVETPNAYGSASSRDTVASNLANPFATTSSGGGAIETWLLILLAIFARVVSKRQ